MSIGLVILVIGLFGLSLSAYSHQNADSETITAGGNSWGINEDIAINSNVSTSDSSPNSSDMDYGQSEITANDGSPQGKEWGGEGSGDINTSDQEAVKNFGQGFGSGNASGNGRGQENSKGDNGRSLEPLSDLEVNALVSAIEEEFGDQALCQGVLNVFGDVEPFNKIVQSEA